MKKHLLTILLLTYISLVGCSSSKSTLEDEIWEQAGVKNEADYQKYQKELQNGEIDAEGYYPQPESQIQKPIHITFWNDRLLDISYYYDAQLMHPVNTDYCYLNYGESLYASISNPVSGYENYNLSSYRIWDESSNQPRLYIENTLADNGKLVFTVPNDESIIEYSVEPIGNYKKEALSFSSNHSGVWYVDGNEAEDGALVTLPSGNDVLAVVYDYSKDANSYYFDSSEPECYSNSEYQGKVYFQLDGKQDSSHSFSVKLEPYHQIHISCDNNISLKDAVVSMSVNGVELPIISDDITRLKPDDKISFTMRKNYKITCNQVDFNRAMQKSECTFSFEMPDTLQKDDNADAIKLDFRIQKWDTQEVKFDVPASTVWEQVIKSLVALYKDDDKKDERANSILTVSTGTSDYTYQDLKNGKSVQIRECDDLKISVSESIKTQHNIQYNIQVGGQKPVFINSGTADKERDITIPYSKLANIGSIKINTEGGFLFSRSNFYTDEKLEIAYLVDGREIADNTFLPEGTVVSVKVKSCPEDYIIQEGGAVDPLTKEGTITVTANTSYDDFAINPIDNTELFSFDPKNYNVENATIEFKRNGSVVSAPIKLHKGEVLEYVVSPNEGYRINQTAGQITVDDEFSTKQALSSIKVFKIEKVTVNLMQPEYGGHIDYFIDGVQIDFQNERVKSKAVMSGTEIRKVYKAWNGWSANLKEDTFLAESDNSNAEPNIDNVFHEDDHYMPVLKVTYDKKVNTSITFGLKAEWLSGNNQSQDTSKQLLCNEKIQTGKNAFVLHSKNGSLLNGTALKVEFVKKYQNGSKKSDETIIRYLNTLPLNESFPIYVDNDRNVLLSEIEVTIKEINVKSYEARRIPNGKLELRYQEKAESPILQNGQIIEADRKVIVTITPSEGYKIFGADTNDSHTQYQKAMKYSDYEKDILKIIKNHEINRICHMTLPPSDEYGTLTYKLDGVSVSGDIEYTEGQKLRITYELTDHNHRIQYASNGPFDYWGNFWGDALSRYKTTHEVILGISHDNTTLNRGDYIKIT